MTPHYLGSAKASVWQADFEDQGLPGVRTITDRDVEALYEAFIAEECQRKDYRNFAFAVISTQLWTEVLRRGGIPVRATRDPCQEIPYLDFHPTERFLCVQGRIRVSAARLFKSAEDHWWPFYYYSDGDATIFMIKREPDLLTVLQSSMKMGYILYGHKFPRADPSAMVTSTGMFDTAKCIRPPALRSGLLN
jgi:hypothetical protein